MQPISSSTIRGAGSSSGPSALDSQAGANRDCWTREERRLMRYSLAIFPYPSSVLPAARTASPRITTRAGPIDALPNELLTLIFEHLKRPDLQGFEFAIDVHHFRLVSRRWAEVASPYIESDSSFNSCFEKSFQWHLTTIANVVDRFASSHLNEPEPPPALRWLFDEFDCVRIGPRLELLAKWNCQLRIRRLELLVAKRISWALEIIEPFDQRLERATTLLHRLSSHPDRDRISVSMELQETPPLQPQAAPRYKHFIEAMIDGDMVDTIRARYLPALSDLLRALPRLGRLTHLDLRSNRIGGVSPTLNSVNLGLIQELLTCPRLKLIDLRNNPIREPWRDVLKSAAERHDVTVLLDEV